MKCRFAEMEIQGKYKELQIILKGLGEVLVAFSGGVDSTFLLRAAIDTLNTRVLAVTALSATTPTHEKQAAQAYAKATGVRYITLPSNEMEHLEFIENPSDKCYFCKKIRFGALIRIATERRIPWVVDGENMDDQTDYRPGSRAARELHVRSPLREAGLTKKEIRQLSRSLGLPTWDNPSCACLASRIPYGQLITPEKLKQVDAGEAFIRTLGISKEVRVRHEGDTARIEIAANAIDAFLDPPVRQKLVSYLKSLGFLYVALDLEGYGIGRLNRAINET